MTKVKKQYAHEQAALSGIKTKTRLAEILFQDWDSLKKMSASYKNYYNVFPRTENDKTRIIEEPVKEMRVLHDRIASLLSRITPPDFLFCPVKGRSSISNAREHLTEGEMVKLDISKYFPSTTFGRIFNFFHDRMTCSRDVTWQLTSLCTYDGHLPTGSPLSPYLSYYAHEDMWLEIKRICDDAGYKISVYMDDMGISAERLDGRIIWQIKQEIQKYGLKYHKEKKYEVGQARLLTGAIIKDGRLKLRNAHHLKIRNTKRELAACTDPDEKERLKASLRGLLSYKKQVEGTN